MLRLRPASQHEYLPFEPLHLPNGPLYLPHGSQHQSHRPFPPTERSSAGWTLCQLGAAARADDVAALALHDGRQGVVEADGTLEQRGQVAACKQHVTYHIDTGTTLNRVLIVFSCKAVVSRIMNGRVI